MTVMQQAFADAERRTGGAHKMPFIERVWRYIKDHPYKTANEVGKALGSNRSHGALGDLAERKMVEYKLESRQIGKFTKRIRVYKACIPEFEMLPNNVRKGNIQRKKGTGLTSGKDYKTNSTGKGYGIVDIAKASETRSVIFKVDIYDNVILPNDLKLSDARKIHEELSKVFK